MKPKAAVQAIEKNRLLLVYPANNEKDPASLWSVFYPRSKMRWDWDDSGDNRVAELWYMKEELSRSKKVVYAKWFKGRATFLSRDTFRSLVAIYLRAKNPLSRDARQLLALMLESSPRSTKELKKESGLQGRLLESTYARAMQELWIRLRIVAFGEVDDGAFPSLAVGASRLLFEELVREAQELSVEKAHKNLEPLFSSSPAVRKFFDRTLLKVGGIQGT